ncbi:unnamed protein product, partial [Meganyctiphanes norvegica]
QNQIRLPQLKLRGIIIMKYDFKPTQNLLFLELIACDENSNRGIYNYLLTWYLYSGRPLPRHHVDGNVLMLGGVGYRDAGLYTCLVANAIGDGQSNAVALKVNYRPVCRIPGMQTVEALAEDEVQLECALHATPPLLSYTWWSLPSNLIHQQWDGTERSLARVVAAEGIKVSCGAANALGDSRNPCQFSIKIVGLPGGLQDCKAFNITPDSATVICLPGSDVGLQQHFQGKVFEVGNVSPVWESLSPSAEFHISGLSPSTTYVVSVRAEHRLGQGPETQLHLATTGPHMEQLAPEMVSDNPVQQEMDTEENDEMVMPQIEKGVIVVGFVLVVVGIASGLTMVLVWRSRQNDQGVPPGSSSNSRVGSRRTSTTTQNRQLQDSLLDLPHGAMYDEPTNMQSKELLTTFLPGPTIVTQLTSSVHGGSVQSLPHQQRPGSAASTTTGRRQHRSRSNTITGGHRRHRRQHSSLPRHSRHHSGGGPAIVLEFESDQWRSSPTTTTMLLMKRADATRGQGGFEGQGPHNSMYRSHSSQIGASDNVLFSDSLSNMQMSAVSPVVILPDPAQATDLSQYIASSTLPPSTPAHTHHHHLSTFSPNPSSNLNRCPSPRQLDTHELSSSQITQPLEAATQAHQLSPRVASPTIDPNTPAYNPSIPPQSFPHIRISSPSIDPSTLAHTQSIPPQTFPHITQAHQLSPRVASPSIDPNTPAHNPSISPQTFPHISTSQSQEDIYNTFFTSNP